jgi:putative FmdB family regulatory protein
MPLYEYYCRTCEATFEKLRPLTVSDQPAECPSGHPGAGRTITVFATLGRAGREEQAPPISGGCCGGGGCACGAARN